MNSIHPWSSVVSSLWAKLKGVIRMPWAVVGTKNHIIAFKWWGHLKNKEDEVVELNEVIIHATQPPVMVTNKADSFKLRGRTGSIIGWNIYQFIKAPLKIAPRVKLIIGRVIVVSSSEVYWYGRLLKGPQITVSIIRIE